MSTDKPQSGEPPKEPRKTTATLLVEIANELYTFHRTADSRGHLGEVVSEGVVYARMRDNRDVRRPLEQVRDDIAAMFQMRFERAPSRTSLGDAMTVLTGMARQAPPDSPDPVDELLASHPAVTRMLSEHPERLKVHAGGRNPFDAAREVADHLLKANEPPRLFAMGPSAAVLLTDSGKLDALDQDGWLAYVAERVDFLSRGNDGDKIVTPPIAVLKITVAIILRELPQLDGVTSTPYLDAAGNLVASDGYHPGSQLVLRTDGLTLPQVADRPTRAQVSEAARLLTEDWLGDFPFATSADKANMLAELLTLTGREMFPLSPMFVHDASTSGSGKGLLLLTLSVIATGQPPEVMELPGDGDEQRKTVTSVLLSGKLLVAWDELHVISGRTLAAILTAEVYSGRILGANKLATVRNKLVQVALGNNVEVRGDMKRRVLPCRLVPDTDHPEHRTEFRHADLPGWVRDNRGDLLAAAFTLWRNWLARGRAEADVTMGSFERWARTIGGVLQAAGIPGFGTNTADWLTFSEEDNGWPDHLRQLRNRFGAGWFTVSQVADAVAAGYLKRPPLKRDPDKELSLQLAYAYRSQRERWYGALRLVRSAGRDSAKGGYTWAVRQRGEDAYTDDDAARELPASSSVCSASPETAGQGTNETTGDDRGDPEHLQEAARDLQEIGGSKSPGQRPGTEHPGDTEDKSGRTAATELSTRKTASCPDCNESEDSVIHAVCCLGEDPAA